MKEQLAINFGKYLVGPKTQFHWKKCFSWRLGKLFRCFEWKYCALSEKFFYVCYISTLFPLQVFTFLWIDWVRFKTRLAKGPILELADWTAKSTKSKSLIYTVKRKSASWYWQAVHVFNNKTKQTVNFPFDHCFSWIAGHHVQLFGCLPLDGDLQNVNVFYMTRFFRLKRFSAKSA